VRGSDLKVRHGHSSKQGSAWLRWAMNQAAQTAKRSPQFAATYAGIAKRRGKKIATIAIARKLLARAWHLLNQMQLAEASTPPRLPWRREGRQAPRVRSLSRHEPAARPNSIT
jgi:hypothetical protein